MRTLLVLCFMLLGWQVPSSAQLGQGFTSQDQLIGTWRAVEVKVGEPGSMQGKTLPWPDSFFMRFYADGTLVTWPPHRPGVRTRFEVREGKLFLPDIRPQGAPLGVTADQMWYSSEQGDTMYFRRVADLEPGANP